MGGRAAPRLGLALVLVALAAARAHPLDRYHTVDADPRRSRWFTPRERREKSPFAAPPPTRAATAPARVIDAAEQWQRTRTGDPPHGRQPRRRRPSAPTEAHQRCRRGRVPSSRRRRERKPTLDAPRPPQRSRRPRTRPPHTQPRTPSATPSSVVDEGGTRVRALRRVLRGLGRPPPRRSEASTVAATARATAATRPGRINGTFTMKKLGDQHPARHGGVLRDGASRGDGGRVPRALLEIRVHPVFRDTAPTAKPGNRAPGGKLVTNTLSLQRLSDFGLESVSTRSCGRARRARGSPADPWNDHPDPVPVDQIGIFLPRRGRGAERAVFVQGRTRDAARGEEPSRGGGGARFRVLAGDRHTQNVRGRDGSIRPLTTIICSGNRCWTRRAGDTARCPACSSRGTWRVGVCVGPRPWKPARDAGLPVPRGASGE